MAERAAHELMKERAAAKANPEPRALGMRGAGAGTGGMLGKCTSWIDDILEDAPPELAEAVPPPPSCCEKDAAAHRESAAILVRAPNSLICTLRRTCE